MRCGIDSLEPGQTETITIVARLAPDSRGKTVAQQHRCDLRLGDPNPALATDTVSFVPIPAADLELTRPRRPTRSRRAEWRASRSRSPKHGPSSRRT